LIHIQNILVPVDFSEASTNAACFAASLARAYHARLYVLHVKEPFPAHGRIMAGSLEDIRRHRRSEEKKQLIEVIPGKLKNSINVEEIQVTGMPVARVIVEMARKLRVDVIVIASQAPMGLMRFVKKDLAQEVLQDALCSVFVIGNRRGKKDESIDDFHR
jgi:nucleotide-binding universal stress UspA family protein